MFWLLNSLAIKPHPIAHDSLLPSNPVKPLFNPPDSMNVFNVEYRDWNLISLLNELESTQTLDSQKAVIEKAIIKCRVLQAEYYFLKKINANKYMDILRKSSEIKDCLPADLSEIRIWNARSTEEIKILHKK